MVLMRGHLMGAVAWLHRHSILPWALNVDACGCMWPEAPGGSRGLKAKTWRFEVSILFR
jgi:hypothetical protein